MGRAGRESNSRREGEEEGWFDHEGDEWRIHRRDQPHQNAARPLIDEQTSRARTEK